MKLHKINVLFLTLLLSGNTMRGDSLADAIKVCVGVGLCAASYKTLPHTKAALDNVQDDIDAIKDSIKKRLRNSLGKESVKTLEKVTTPASKNLLTDVVNAGAKSVKKVIRANSKETVDERRIKAAVWTTGTLACGLVGLTFLISGIKSK